MGGAPGLFTLLFFLDPDGSMSNMIIALLTGAISIAVSFFATTFILRYDKKRNEAHTLSNEAVLDNEQQTGR